MTVVLLARARTQRRVDLKLKITRQLADQQCLGRPIEVALCHPRRPWSPELAVELQDQILEEATKHDNCPVIMTGIHQLVHGGPEAVLDLLERLAKQEIQIVVHEQLWMSTLLWPGWVARAALEWVIEAQRLEHGHRLREASLDLRLNAGDDERPGWGGGEMATIEEHAKIHELNDRGWTIRAIATTLDLSKSQVHRRLHQDIPDDALDDPEVPA